MAVSFLFYKLHSMTDFNQLINDCLVYMETIQCRFIKPASSLTNVYETFHFSSHLLIRRCAYHVSRIPSSFCVLASPRCDIFMCRSYRRSEIALNRLFLTCANGHSLRHRHDLQGCVNLVPYYVDGLRALHILHIYCNAFDSGDSSGGTV